VAERQTRRQLIMLALTLALGLMTVYIVWRWGGVGDAAPTDQTVPFVCTRCGLHFVRSHAEIDQLWERKEFRQVPGVRQVRFLCPQCQDYTAERAEPDLDAP